jgi:hypothetical protein
MSLGFSKSRVALGVAAALGAGTFAVTPATTSADTRGGTYLTGDFHNHTTCSDGSTSMQRLIDKSTDAPWGLDWFIQAGHGGNGTRNCTLAEDASLATPAYPLVFASDGTTPLGPNTTWTSSNPPITPKGRFQLGSSGGAPQSQVMWRWQSIEEFQYPVLEYLSALKSQPLFIGLESVVAGHEHTSMSVITGQMPLSAFRTPLPTGPGYTALGSATSLAMWSYCFDRGDTDTSRGNTVVGGTEGHNWDCSVPGSLNASDPSWNAGAMKLMPASGVGSGERGHAKTLEALKWMAEFHPDGSYYVPAHLERAGPFNPDSNNGYNIEHLRNFNNVAPDIAFGMETQPGHGASDARGEYNVNRNNFGGTIGFVDTVGGTTYGGTGVYGAQIGGVWDALLGEGRAWWFFASSDWHNRGSFGHDDRRTTQDFFPGEYQRDYVMVHDTDGERVRRDRLTPQEIVDGLRSGNSWTDSGQLIDRLVFVACADTRLHNVLGNAIVEAAALLAAVQNSDVDLPGCATMGEKLVVRPNSDVVVAIVVRDPAGTSFSPYTFPNPSLKQIGVVQPLNRPVLDHIDVIRGLVTGYKQPGAADYSGEWPRNWINDPNLASVPAGAKNTSATILRTFNSATWKAAPGHSSFTRGYRSMTFRLRALKASQYVRLRGTNLPAALQFETDADGNPLPDIWTNPVGITPSLPGATDGAPENANLRIPCTTVGTTEFDGCPSHLGVRDGQKYSSFDVAAWADLWFYSNPIYIEVKGSTVVAGVQ